MTNESTRDYLKGKFKTGSKPSEKDFAELIDGMLNQQDDGLLKESGKALRIITPPTGDKTLLRFNGDINSNEQNDLKLQLSETGQLKLVRDGAESFIEFDVNPDDKNSINPAIRLSRGDNFWTIGSRQDNAFSIQKKGNEDDLRIDQNGHVTISNDMTIKNSLSVAGNLEVTGDLTIKPKDQEFNKLIVTTTDYWGDNDKKQLTLVGTSYGLMIRNLHIPWNKDPGYECASIRLGMSRDDNNVSGCYWDIGTRKNNKFSITQNADPTYEPLSIDGNGNVKIGNNKNKSNLEVNGKLTVNTNGAANFWTIGSCQDNAFSIQKEGNEDDLRIDQNGNVTISNNMTIKKSLSVTGSLEVTGDLTIKSKDANEAFNKLIVTTRDDWGDNNQQLTLVGQSKGLMIRDLHIPWNDDAGYKSASIRMGRSGGIKSGCYWDIGTREDDKFSIQRNATLTDEALSIDKDGLVTIGNDKRPSNLHVFGRITSPMWKVTQLAKASNARTSGDFKELPINLEFETKGGKLLFFISAILRFDSGHRTDDSNPVSIPDEPIILRGTLFPTGSDKGIEIGTAFSVREPERNIDQQNMTCIVSDHWFADNLSEGSYKISLSGGGMQTHNFSANRINLTVIEFPF